MAQRRKFKCEMENTGGRSNRWTTGNMPIEENSVELLTQMDTDFKNNCYSILKSTEHLSKAVYYINQVNYKRRTGNISTAVDN